MGEESCIARGERGLSARRWVFALAILVAGLAPWVSASAQMETDGTMGAAQVLVGPNFDIGADAETHGRCPTTLNKRRHSTRNAQRR